MGVWPSGPDGKPLPKDPSGEPVWPSEDYRLAYQQAQAADAARRDQANPLLFIVLLGIRGLIIGLASLSALGAT